MLKRLWAYADWIPFIAAVLIVVCYTPNVPVSDDWDIIPVIERIKNGTCDWRYLNEPYNGHKMIVSLPFMAMASVSTHFDRTLLELVGLLILLGAWMAIRPLTQELGVSVVAAMLFWGWHQYTSWLWPWQINLNITIFCGLWAIRLMNSERVLNGFLALTLALIGTLSYSGAVAVWPALFYLMYVRRSRRAVMMGATIFAFVLTVCLYRWHQQSLSLNIQNPLNMMALFLNGIGCTVVPIRGYCTIITGILALGLLYWVEKPIRPMCVGLMLYALGMLAMITVAPATIGAKWIYSGEARYGTMVMVFWVALLVAVTWTGWRKYVLMLIFFLAVARAATKAPQIMPYVRPQAEALQVLKEGKPLSYDQKLAIRMNAEKVFDLDDGRMELLKKWKYSLFRDSDR